MSTVSSSTCAGFAPSLVARPTLPIKVFFETTHSREIRRTRIAADASWEEAIQLFGGLFPDSYVVVSYVDADGDTVTVETANEWKEALRQHAQSFGLQTTLRITLDATQPVTHAQTQHHVVQQPQAYSGRGYFEQPEYTDLYEPRSWERSQIQPDVVSLDSHEQGSSTQTQSPQHEVIGDAEEASMAQDLETQESPRTEVADESPMLDVPDTSALQASLSVTSSVPSSSSNGPRGVRSFLPASVSGAVDETIGEFVKHTSSQVATTLRSVFANMRELFEVPILEPAEQPQHQQIQAAPVIPPVAIPMIAEQEQAHEDDESVTENDAYSTEFEDEEPEPEMPEPFEAEEAPAQMPPPPFAPTAVPEPGDEEILFHMGFTDLAVVRQTLQLCNNNVEQALDMLLAQAATPRL